MQYNKALAKIKDFLRHRFPDQIVLLVPIKQGELVFIPGLTDEHFERFINEAVKLNYIHICFLGKSVYFQLTQDGSKWVKDNN